MVVVVVVVVEVEVVAATSVRSRSSSGSRELNPPGLFRGVFFSNGLFFLLFRLFSADFFP